jgi:hypothetical protein
MAATVANLTLVAVKMEMMKVARCINTVLFSRVNDLVAFLITFSLFSQTLIPMNTKYRSIQRNPKAEFHVPSTWVNVKV